MKAMTIKRFGEPEVFEPADIARPQAGPDQILVRVTATSVNPVDWKVRRLGPPFAPELPVVLHGDVAGTVEAVGDRVSEFAPGDLVYGFAGGIRGFGGALAEFMACDADLMAPQPGSMGAEAAALPLVSITAWEGIVDRARTGPGDKVLVHAGTGGVGHVALQIARARGAEVFATVSGPEKAAIVEMLGATAINYRENSVADYVEQHTGGVGFDIVYDTIGGDTLSASLTAARLNGTVVSCQINSNQDLTPMHQKGLNLYGVFILIPMLHGPGRARHGEILREVAKLVDRDDLAPLIDEERFRLEEVAAAHARLESGQAIGKVLVEVAA